MCTNFALIKSEGVKSLTQQLEIDFELLRYGRDFKPGSKISIVVDANGGREVLDAIWWLYLHQTPEGLKPDPDYFSVNTNHAKLPKKSEYKKSRCIILASSFFESQDGKQPHELSAADGSAIAFGGLWKHWVDKTTGEMVHSASIITLAGHPALANIHRKSVPLWLPNEDFDAWLSRDNTDTRIFDHLLVPQLRTDLKATPIDKVGIKNPVGEAFIIPRQTA
jgi:putative SOS response-associated peptidase YedK